MNLEKITNKLTELFDTPERKQAENQEKLSKIISKLEVKKATLKEEMVTEGEKDETSETYNELEKEYKVVNKLLKKAKKKSL